MSLERVDARFLLSEAPRSAVVIGDLAGWSEGLALAEIESPAPTSRPPDLVVAPAARLREAARAQPRAIILEGRSAATRAQPGWHATRCVALPDVTRPDLLLPLGSPAVVRHALAPRLAGSGLRGARNRLGATMLAHGVVPPGRQPITILEREPLQPFLVRASARLGVPEDVSWYLAPGQGGPLARGVFHLFRAGDDESAWVLKFNRLPGYEERFDRDAGGHEAARAAGERVLQHATRLLGRIEVDGIHASVETAARGTRLSDLLASGASREDKLKRVHLVAHWLLAIAAESRAEPAALEPEREQLRREVLPHWPDAPVDELVAMTREVPATFRHGDASPWNVFVDDDDFTLIDWEDSHLHGFPLWDLIRFLVDAYALVDGAVATADDRTEHMARLCRGELESSPDLFDWIERTTSAAAVPPEAVGALVTMLWLSMARYAARHAERARRHSVAAAERPHPVLFAERWLADPALGTEWPSRRDRRRPSGP